MIVLSLSLKKIAQTEDTCQTKKKYDCLHLFCRMHIIDYLFLNILDWKIISFSCSLITIIYFIS